MTAPAVETPVAVAEPQVETTPAPPAPVAPVAPVVPTPPAKPEGPLSRREAKRGLQETLHTRAAELAAPVAAPEGRSPDITSEPSKTLEAAVAPTGGAVAPVAPVAPKPPQPIRIPVPEGHPIREMGVEFFTAHSPQEERALRASLNSYTRRNEVVTLQAKVDDYARKEAEREAREAAQQKWTARPEYKAVMARYQEIKDSFGEADAEQYLRGFNADFEQLAAEETQQRMSQIDEQNIQQAAEGWKNEALANVTTLPEAIRRLPAFSQWFEQAVHSFNAEIELGHYPQLKTAEGLHKEFMRFFSSRLTKEPDVVGVYRALGARETEARTAAAARAAEGQRRIEKIKQDAVEEFKKSVAAKHTGAPPHPLGNLGPSRDRMPAGSEAAEPAANVPVNQLRRDAKAAARERARQRFGVT